MSLIFQEIDAHRRRRRIVQFSIIVSLVFGALGYRLFVLQIVDGERLRASATSNFTRREHIEPQRGRILDRNGTALAYHRATFELYVKPKQLADLNRFSDEISQILGLDEHGAIQLSESLLQHKANGVRRAMRLPYSLTRDQVSKVEALASLSSGFEVKMTYIRHYPEGTVGAHVLGYLGLVSAKELKNDPLDRLTTKSRVGRFGIEAKYESVLAGRPGFRQFAVDARGRRVDAPWTESQTEGFLNHRSPVSGQDVVLTIDARVQRILKKRLRRKQSGAAIVLNVHSGDILGMVSHPSFDPNRWSRGLTAEEKKRIDENQYHPMLDKVVHAYFPGSLYKLVTAYGALQDEVITHTELVESPGAYEFGNRTFHCHKRSGHGHIDLRTALAASADVYFYKLGETMGIDRLADYGRLFGFGTQTELRLNGEQAGRVPTRAFHESQTKGGFQHGLALSTAVGQGAVRTSPLQLALAYAAAANGGRLLAPRLVSKLQHSDGSVTREMSSKIVRTLAPSYPKTFESLLNGFEFAVQNDKRGTAQLARSKHVRVSGKTGTAQVRKLARGFNRQDVTRFTHRDHAWFAALVPSSAPQWVVVVFLEHGGSGGKNAAPIARQIIDDIHLQVQPLVSQNLLSRPEVP